MNGSEGDESPSQLIDAKIASLGDWRGETLARVRKIIRETDPDVVEEVKWRKPSNPAGVPIWSHSGMICSGETYKDKVKLTFAYGASLDDPSGLFNSSLEGNTRRAIDFHEGDKIDEKALKELIRGSNAQRGNAQRVVRRWLSEQPVRTTITGALREPLWVAGRLSSCASASTRA